MSDDTRPRFIDGPAYRLQRMEHVITQGELDVARARARARRALRGVVFDVLILGLLGHLLYTYGANLPQEDLLMSMLFVVMAGSSLTIPIHRVRAIREARAELAERREAVARLRHDRIVHIRQLEEVSGGLSLAGGGGGELTEAG